MIHLVSYERLIIILVALFVGATKEYENEISFKGRRAKGLQRRSSKGYFKFPRPAEEFIQLRYLAMCIGVWPTYVHCSGEYSLDY